MDEIIKFQIRENGCVEIFPITREQLLWPWEIGHLAESHCALGLELASALKECIRLKYSLNIENEAILRSLGPEYHSIGNPWKTSGLARYAGYIQNKKMRIAAGQNVYAKRVGEALAEEQAAKRLQKELPKPTKSKTAQPRPSRPPVGSDYNLQHHQTPAQRARQTAEQQKESLTPNVPPQQTSTSKEQTTALWVAIETLADQILLRIRQEPSLYHRYFQLIEDTILECWEMKRQPAQPVRQFANYLQRREQLEEITRQAAQNMTQNAALRQQPPLPPLQRAQTSGQQHMEPNRRAAQQEPLQGASILEQQNMVQQVLLLQQQQQRIQTMQNQQIAQGRGGMMGEAIN